jgi:hypothetical protein
MLTNAPSTPGVFPQDALAKMPILLELGTIHAQDGDFPIAIIHKLRGDGPPLQEWQISWQFRKAWKQRCHSATGLGLAFRWLGPTNSMSE